MRYQELCFSAFVLGAAIASDNCRHYRNMRPEPPFPVWNSATIRVGSAMPRVSMAGEGFTLKSHAGIGGSATPACAGSVGVGLGPLPGDAGQASPCSVTSFPADRSTDFCFNRLVRSRPRSAVARPQPRGLPVLCRVAGAANDTSASPCSVTHFPPDRSRDFLI
jgi:hypothetical protein